MIETHYTDEYFMAYEHHGMYPMTHAKMRPDWCEICTQIVQYEESRKSLRIGGTLIILGVLPFAALFIGLITSELLKLLIYLFNFAFYGGPQ